MTTEVAVALIGAAVVILGIVVAQMVRLSQRIRRLEQRDRLSWLYIRSLIDHAYKHAPGVPLPEPPDGWLDATE